MPRRSHWFPLSVLMLLPSIATAQPPSAVGAWATLDTGCNGGFTGGGNGVSLAANGHFIAWTQPTAGAPRDQTDLGIDKAIAVALTAALEDISFSNIEFDERGNMTCSLTFRDHTVTWPIGNVEVPAAVVEIHERLMGVARR